MSFDAIAPHYTWMEAVLAGRRLQRCRVTWLESLAAAHDILVLGVGHGHFVRRCAARFPAARITAVDASTAMLHAAETRLRRSEQPDAPVTFIRATLPAWSPDPASFDAIVTHFFLDCFAPAELAAVIGNLSRAARPAARWLVSDFAVPPRGLARHRARAVHALMYAFFRRVTQIRARRVTPPDAWLAAEGFSLAGRRASEWGLLQADLWVRTG